MTHGISVIHKYSYSIARSQKIGEKNIARTEEFESYVPRKQRLETIPRN